MQRTLINRQNRMHEVIANVYGVRSGILWIACPEVFDLQTDWLSIPRCVYSGSCEVGVNIFEDGLDCRYRG